MKINLKVKIRYCGNKKNNQIFSKNKHRITKINI